MEKSFNIVSLCLFQEYMVSIVTMVYSITVHSYYTMVCGIYTVVTVNSKTVV